MDGLRSLGKVGNFWDTAAISSGLGT